MTPSDSTTMHAPRLLHLGCGRMTPSEWVNIDGSFNAWLARRPVLRKLVEILRIAPGGGADFSWARNVVVTDLRKRFPFADESFDAVYSSHFLEHLYRSEAVAALRESHRVLKPGGRCRHMVPDLGAMVAEYNEKSGGGDDPARHFISILQMCAQQPDRGGLLYRIYLNLTDFHPHKWMYDVQSLAKLMEEAGFKECRPSGYLQTEIPHIDKVEKEDRAAGAVIVEGVKA